MSEKRGVIEIQFNWVFVLIVGAIILLFFIMVAQRLQKGSEVKLEGTIGSNLKAMLVGSESAEGAAHEVEIPQDFTFDCYGFGVGKTQRVKVGASFAPPQVKEGFVSLWSLDWSVPFKIMNFLYVTSEQVRYIIIYGSASDEGRSLALELNKTMSQEIEVKEGVKKEIIYKEVMTVEDYNRIRDDIGKDGNYRIRLVVVLVEGEVAEPPTPREVEWSILKVTSGDKDLGKLKFYSEDDETGKPSAYLGKEMLIAAIFAEDPDSYHCNIATAFKKLSVISEIYSKRTQTLVSTFNSNADWTACSSPANGAKTAMDNIKTNAEAIVNILAGASISQEDADSMYDKMHTIYSEATGTLAQNNDYLEQRSCPILY